ncbi:NUDIX hydrolase [Nocardia mexicana]|uniref:NUDIX hydrolase n=1 Tax=Nocardia mexicana TaxID=279262 RepID=UPI000A05E017
MGSGGGSVRKRDSREEPGERTGLVTDGIPAWLHGVVERKPADPTGVNPVLNRTTAQRLVSAALRPRLASVLVLFGGAAESDPDAPGGLPSDADVLLTQRAATLRQHRGQVAFPGGGVEPGDDGPIGTALREAREETGLDPVGVEPIAVLPKIFVPPSRFDVTPVVAYWRTPGEVGVVSETEAARVVRVPIADLIDPANRFVVRHPMGYMGPAFAVDGMLVWGFTAGVLAGLLAVSGWEREWDHHDVRDLQASLAAVGMTL